MYHLLSEISSSKNQFTSFARYTLIKSIAKKYSTNLFFEYDTFEFFEMALRVSKSVLLLLSVTSSNHTSK